jgi:PKD repeat protein
MTKKNFFISFLIISFLMGCNESSFNNPTESDEPGEPNQKPIAVIKANPTTSETPPLEVQFDARDSNDKDGNIVSYNWNFGDETTGTGDTISHTYDKAGTYTTTLTVTDDTGDTGTNSVSIIIDCDIVHKGDLVIKGDETFEIKDCTDFHDKRKGTKLGVEQF